MFAFANNVLRERIQGASGSVGMSRINSAWAGTRSALDVNADPWVSIVSLNAPRF
jgi:hypothetical protein